jgi:2-dehydropantoate 2-reductase
MQHSKRFCRNFYLRHFEVCSSSLSNRQPWRVTDDPIQIGPVDVVVVGVKTWQLPEVARALPALVGPHTCVVPLQNGVEASAQLAAAVGARAVLGGCCRIMSARVAPGHIQHRGSLDPALLVGESDNRRSARVAALCQVLGRAGWGRSPARRSGFYAACPPPGP